VQAPVPSTPSARKRILFFAESVTLSQVTRLACLARALDPSRYEVHFASAEFGELLFSGTRYVRHQVRSIDPERMMRSLRAGRRIYDARTLIRYAHEDLQVLDAVRPHLVVSDFRLSMPVSARVAGVRHAAIINAYFSPHAVRDGFPVPDHPMVDLLGPVMAARYFPQAIPFVFAHFVKPVQALREHFGLPRSGSLLEVLTDADHVLHPDTAELVPTAGAPARHEYLGPVIWSPEVPLPAWWSELPRGRPLVYATLGSSGDLAALPAVLKALARLDVTTVVATASRSATVQAAGNVYVAPFLPGNVVARLADIVVSNGGSSTSYQALAEGTPVVGIASNFDQYLAMTAIEAAGAGKLVRAGHVTDSAVASAVTTVLGSASYRDAAARVQRNFASHDAAARFVGFVERATTQPPPAATPRRTSGRGVRTWLATLALAGCALAAPDAVAEDKPAPPKPSAPPAAGAPAPPGGEIRFTTDTKHSKGHVICALFRRSGWLKKDVQHVKADIKNKVAECVFSNVEKGWYGIIAFHDENDNGDIDKNFLGIPTEDWCASRDASGFMGPPQFDSAKFPLTSGVVRLRAPM
jgi:UDP:flavonoid glycosyltransferase YjiC (YdhE family)/uncharacterized protein (DUF2141 family)